MQVSSTGFQDAKPDGLFYQIHKDSFWMRVPGIAWFLVQSGRRIQYRLAEKADTDSMRLFLLGSCMGLRYISEDIW